MLVIERTPIDRKAMLFFKAQLYLFFFTVLHYIVMYFCSVSRVLVIERTQLDRKAMLFFKAQLNLFFYSTPLDSTVLL